MSFFIGRLAKAFQTIRGLPERSREEAIERYVLKALWNSLRPPKAKVEQMDRFRKNVVCAGRRFANFYHSYFNEVPA
jgi:hypothetical protein